MTDPTSVWRRWALVCIVALALLAVPAAAGSVYDVDDGHDLTSPSAIDRYEAEGVASAGVPGIDMSLTVADDASDVGLSRWHRSSGRTYLKIDYREEIDREVRVYIPTEYWSPRLKRGLESETGGPPITLEPVNERHYTAVTIELSGETSAVYAIPASRGKISSTRSKVSDIVSNATGISLPSMDSGGEQWQYVPEQALAGENVTTAIETNGTDLSIQYDAASAPGEERWVPVQRCSRAENQPVCTVTKEGQHNVTHLLSTVEDPPPVRYKSEAGRVSSVKAAVNDLKTAVSRTVSKASGLLPGGD